MSDKTANFQGLAAVDAVIAPTIMAIENFD
jgi:hypothetical protein